MSATTPVAEPQTIEEVADGLISTIGRPVDAWAVAGTLESQGMRDVDARERYGRPNLFVLATDVYGQILLKPWPPLKEFEPEEKLDGPRQGVAALVARGGFFFIPLALQLGALVVLGYGQFSSLGFSTRQATLVGVAVVISFLATAGLSQTLGYMGPMFREAGKAHLTRQAVRRTLAASTVTVLVIAGALWGLNQWGGWLTDSEEGVLLAYFAMLSSFWITNAILYMTRHYLAMVIGAVGGIGVVVAVKQGADTDLYTAHWVGLGFSTLVGLVWAGLGLRARARSVHGDLRLARAPRPVTLVRVVAPYFAYGSAYYAFLFSDRIVAWSEGRYPLPLWFRTAYELGLVAALVSVVPGIALLEYTVNEFSKALLSVPLAQSGLRADEHNAKFRRFYGRHLMLLAGLLVLGALAGYVIVRVLSGTGVIGRFLADPVTRDVYGFGLLGYILLTVALLNGVFLFSLARPRGVVAGFFPAIALSLGVGLVLSRTVHWWYSVLGLTSGALVLCLISTRQVLRVLGEVDFHAFAAY